MITIEELSEYVAGAKLAGRDDIFLENDALERSEEDCLVLLIPKSKWKSWKEEMP